MYGSSYMFRHYIAIFREADEVVGGETKIIWEDSKEGNFNVNVIGCWSVKGQ
jgi:hypothetical protein